MKVEIWALGKTTEPYLETGTGIFEKTAEKLFAVCVYHPAQCQNKNNRWQCLETGRSQNCVVQTSARRFSGAAR